jgi:cytochrome c2
MLMHSLTRIRAAGYSIMLASVGVFSIPPTAHAQGDAAAGEKVFAHCAPLATRTSRAKTNLDRHWPV